MNCYKKSCLLVPLLVLHLHSAIPSSMAVWKVSSQSQMWDLERGSGAHFHRSGLCRGFQRPYICAEAPAASSFSFAMWFDCAFDEVTISTITWIILYQESTLRHTKAYCPNGFDNILQLLILSHPSWKVTFSMQANYNSSKMQPSGLRYLKRNSQTPWMGIPKYQSTSKASGMKAKQFCLSSPSKIFLLPSKIQKLFCVAPNLQTVIVLPFSLPSPAFSLLQSQFFVER
jgi:hypothetical protein